MSLVISDEEIKNVSVGSVQDLTEDERDSGISCIILNIPVAEKVFLTRSDLFKLLGEMEEAHEQ